MYFKTTSSVIVLCLLLSCKSDHSSFEDVLAVNTTIKTPIHSNSTSTESVKKWIYSMQHVSGLMESANNTNFVSLYDNALAAILFIQDNERVAAEAILDYYLNRMNEEVVPNGGLYQTRTTDGTEAQTLWMGDNAWLLIAINHYKKAYNSPKYDVLGNSLEKWLRSLQEEDGGLIGGKRANGEEMPKITEGIITAFNAVNGYDDFHKNILKFLKNNRWDTEKNILTAWPENPKYAYAMDVHSLSSIVFLDMPINVLHEAERYLNQQEMTTTGITVNGYGFDEDKDVVWLEGTAQMAVAFEAIGNSGKSDMLIKELEKSFISSTIVENAKGIPYASNHGTSYGNSMLWDHADTTPALSSTIWYLFAKASFNPLQLGNKRDIPNSNKFWFQEPTS